ncbi:MAG: urease accessory UreF family protein [Pseudomonadota bacterium]
MSDTTAFLRLMSWLSPVFPTGGFAYSAGLEQAVGDRLVTDTRTLHSWTAAQIEHGSLWNDAVFFAQAHKQVRSRESLEGLIDHATAFTSAHERLAETLDQGTSFIEGASHWIDLTVLQQGKTPLPVCIGYAAGLETIDSEQALSAYLHAFATNQLQSAIRLSVLGQSGAAETLAMLEPTIAATAKRAASATLEDLGTSAFFAEIAAMKHESLQPRIFKS